MARLITEWSTDDPQIADMLRSIDSETNAVLRLELESALHIWQGMKAARDAERLRCHQSRNLGGGRRKN